jgi:hypothetical protein
MRSGFQDSLAVYTGPSFLDPNRTGEVHVGIPEIDSEHRQLAVQYNALLQALDEGDDAGLFSSGGMRGVLSQYESERRFVV